MKQPNEKGTQKDLVLYRIETAQSDIKAAEILLGAKEFRVANNTWTYLHLKGDYSDYSVSIIGFDGETQTGKVDVPLAANNKIVADWNTVGLVTKIIFSVECSDKMAPTYFCIDDLVYSE